MVVQYLKKGIAEQERSAENDKVKIQAKIESLQSDLQKEKEQNMLLTKENVNLVNEYRDNNLKKDQEFYSDQNKSHNASQLKIEENSTMYLPGSVKFLGYNYWGIASR